MHVLDVWLVVAHGRRTKRELARELETLSGGVLSSLESGVDSEANAFDHRAPIVKLASHVFGHVVAAAAQRQQTLQRQTV